MATLLALVALLGGAWLTFDAQGTGSRLVVAGGLHPGVGGAALGSAGPPGLTGAAAAASGAVAGSGIAPGEAPSAGGASALAAGEDGAAAASSGVVAPAMAAGTSRDGGAPSAVGTTAGACRVTQGTVAEHSFWSPIAAAALSYQIYLPPCYASADRRYPLLVLLPGSDGTDREWIDSLGLIDVLDTEIAAGDLPAMIVALPPSGGLANVDDLASGRSWDSVIVDELLPTLDAHFCTLEGAAWRAIGGDSRGGFWAVEIALRHAGLFGAVGGHSAWFTPDAQGTWEEPLTMAQTAPLPPTTRFWLDAGPADPALPGILQLAATLARRGVDPGLHTYPSGQHDAAYWSAHVPAYLAFYAATWMGAPTPDLSCAPS